MDYEQKKTEALEELKQCARFDIEPAKTILRLFPELEESDYVIKQRLIHLLGYFRSKGIDYNLCDRILKWLEKQGENHFVVTNDMVKSADKVEPKFKLGDWVVYNNKHESIYQIQMIKNGYYVLYHTLGGTLEVCMLHDESLRLWTIADARDGDVLEYQGEIFIIRELKKKVIASRTIEYYCCYDGKHFINNSIYSLMDDDLVNIHPATKEQRDLLFQRMKEVGYKWNAEKKELEKI